MSCAVSRSFFESLFVRIISDSHAAYCIAACRYEALAQQAEAMEKPYTALAKLLNCHADEIAIVTSSTTAWCQVKHHMIAQGLDAEAVHSPDLMIYCS